MNNIDKSYQLLLQDILNNGVEKKDRTGTGTISVFGRQIRHKMSEGFPLLTTKKMPFKTIVTELLWFLRGDTNIKYLVDNGCNIWNGDAYKAYEKQQTNYFIPIYSQEEFINKIKTDDEFAKKWGDLGKIYGAQWRNWGSEIPFGEAISSLDIGVDQIKNLINDLKTNPDSRRLMVNAWNVGELDQMVLPPCHYGFQVYTRELSLDERYVLANINGSKEKLPGEPNYTEEQQHSMLDELVPKRAISLMFNMRSTDVGLGLSFNLASYGLLLMMIAKQVNMIPDELIYNGGDVHLYKNHIEPIKEQLNRTPYELPTVELLGNVDDIAHYELGDIVLKSYKSHPTIKMPLSN